MIVFDNPNIVCFDVDDTLTMMTCPPGHEDETVLFNAFGVPAYLLPHKAHIKLLKEFKVRGHFVVVWSQGGADWAQEVVKCLELEKYVDIVMTKPKWYVDDLPWGAWTKRSYLSLEGKRMPCKDVETVEWEVVDGDKKPSDQE